MKGAKKRYFTVAIVITQTLPLNPAVEHRPDTKTELQHKTAHYARGWNLHRIFTPPPGIVGRE